MKVRLAGRDVEGSEGLGGRLRLLLEEHLVGVLSEVLLILELLQLLTDKRRL